MAVPTQLWSLVLAMCLAAVAVEGRMTAQESGGSACKSLTVKTATYLSPPMTARPGQANSKYFQAEFPKGHIGIRNVYTELVDENGVSLRLSDVYHHHSYIVEYAVPKPDSEMHLQHLLRHMSKHGHKHGLPLDAASAVASFQAQLHHSQVNHTSQQLKMLASNMIVTSGGETRKSDLTLPEPYVLESGKELVEGYEIVRIMNVHGLDTRGAVDPMGCTECRCHLYNVTIDEDGEPLPEDYLGGLVCCGDGEQCAVEEGFNGEEITFHFKYTVEYVDWNDCLIPVSQIIMSITSAFHNLPEFTVEGCGDANPNSEECVETRVVTLISPLGGDVVHVVSHLHAFGLNASIWGEDGRLICESTPIYGQGHEAGDEKGYLVGVTSCLGNAGAAML